MSGASQLASEHYSKHFNQLVRFGLFTYESDNEKQREPVFRYFFTF